MKSILEPSTRNEIISRVSSLSEENQAQWGKMNISQMIRHCSMWDEMALDKTKYKQSYIGKLFGKMALKDFLKDGPVKKNLPTVPSFKIHETGGFAAEKAKWLKLLQEYTSYSGNGFIHPFFGKMTKEQMGQMVYKHIDHHLRQFNA